MEGAGGEVYGVIVGLIGLDCVLVRELWSACLLCLLSVGGRKLISFGIDRAN